MEKNIFGEEIIVREYDDELNCGCMIWGQFIDANIDEITKFCPICGDNVE